MDEAFLKLYRVRHRLATSKNPEAFAFRVVKNALADHCRHRDRRRETGLDGRSPDEADGLLLRLDLRRALDELPPRQGDCMRLFALLDQDVRTIARFLGVGRHAALVPGKGGTGGTAHGGEGMNVENELRAAAAALRLQYDDYDVAAAERRLDRLVAAVAGSHPSVGAEPDEDSWQASAGLLGCAATATAAGIAVRSRRRRH